jgi:hypothetical protein
MALLATNGLARSLRRVGIDIQPVLAAAFGHEKAKQQQASPPAEHEAGGGVSQKPEFAQGGQVFSPEAIGARRAKNGHFYIPDPHRPGKYMIVLPKSGLARARGGAVNHDADKISKAAAHYRDLGYADEKCVLCRMIVWPNKCSAVAGQIERKHNATGRAA